ncbi:universal stress protein [Kibdelosporangium philippinense]|uniref:Universal stress protein n=1 Tax=Kibdelosporangium philippinense TaxID=211113 RepID=A0ABS8Z9W2_9PSEU|nr:universal stress protein [Kibdelosporangium philippinense]MCE7004650.1 universal stress protein [Kibdelosporangium philippinense]
MSKPIVVGVDGQPGSDIALGWAIAEAARRARRLMLLHVGEVWSPPFVGDGSLMAAIRTRGQQVIEKALTVVHATNRNVQVSSLVLPGDPPDVLISWSSEASMLVLGDSVRASLATVPRTVAARSRCPLIVVRTQWSDQLPVVVGVDGSPVTRAAIEFAFDHAAQHRTWVRAVHAWHRSVLPGDRGIVEERAAHFAVVADALEQSRQRYPLVPVHISRPIGHAAEVLSEQSTAAQLLVVGTRGHSGVAGLLLGSVSQALLRTAGCPLAVIPAEKW